MLPMRQPTHHNGLSPEDAGIILRLRLLIARAASKDSLAWWEDHSLTPEASFVLERIFPMQPDLAARNLALAAARARHQAACPSSRGIVHLYRLDSDGQDELAMRSVSVLAAAVPETPIDTTDLLRRALLEVLGQPMPYRALRRTDAGGLEISVPLTPTGVAPLLHRARTLAWAYLEGDRAKPAFPYCQERVT